MTPPESGGGPSLPELPSLPDDAAGRAVDVLSGLADAFNQGVYGLGERISELLPMLADVVGVLA